MHPWDLVDEGVDVVLGRISDMGLDQVGLATSYHQGRYVLPHNPRRRVYSAEEGVVYFEPHLEFYKDTVLKPRRSTVIRDDALASLLERAREYGVKVKSWTVCLHNHEFVRQFPDLALVDLYGHRDSNFICPNNPNSSNYVLALTKDLASRHELDAISLESFAYPWGFEHFDHHEMFGTYVEPLFDYLLTTCFCEFCERKATEEGLDLQRSREVAKGIVEASIKMSPRVQQGVPLGYQFESFYDLTNDLEELRALLSFKQATATRVLQGAREVLNDMGSSVKLGIATQTTFRGHEGINLARVSGIVDNADMATYLAGAEPIEYLTRWLSHEVSGRCKLNVTLRTSHPMTLSPAAVRAQILAVKAGGADGIGFYNYGWTPLETFDVIKDGLAEARRDQGRAPGGSNPVPSPGGSS